MKLLDDYLSIQEKLFKYFGYVENWVVIPVDDARKYYWKLSDSQVCFADTEKELNDMTGNYYENQIYKQRFLSKWVYLGEKFTMICVDTNVDGNKFLQIFSNDKKVKL